MADADQTRVVSEDADFALKRSSVPQHRDCTRGTVTASVVPLSAAGAKRLDLGGARILH